MTLMLAVFFTIDRRIGAGAEIEQCGQHFELGCRQPFFVAKHVKCVERHDAQDAQRCSGSAGEEEWQSAHHADDRDQRGRDEALTMMANLGRLYTHGATERKTRCYTQTFPS